MTLNLSPNVALISELPCCSTGIHDSRYIMLSNSPIKDICYPHYAT